MTYTIYNDPEIDKKVENDLKYINSQILHLLGKHVHSIILCGSFGRGEGGVYKNKEKIHIVNDYDIIIILKENNPVRFAFLYKKYKQLLHNLADELAADLEMKQVDLDLKHNSYFKNPQSLKIENYEVKMGHIIIYGNEDITTLMPNWKAKDIPIFEGTRLFFNRGSGLLIAALYFNAENGIPSHKRENFIIECNKAQLAMGDSILLLKNSYHYLYSERLNLTESLDVSDVPWGQDIMIHYREALEQKLRPDFQKFYARDLVEWWFNISELFDKFYLYFESVRLGKSIDNWIDYSNLQKPGDTINVKIFLKNILNNKLNICSPRSFIRNYRKSQKYFYINIAPLLLFTIKRNKFIKSFLTKASNLLDIPLKKAPKEDWLRLVKAFLYEWHPEGEVNDAISL